MTSSPTAMPTPQGPYLPLCVIHFTVFSEAFTALFYVVIAVISFSLVHCLENPFLEISNSVHYVM